MKKLLVRIFILLKGHIILRILNKTPRILFYHGVDKVKFSEIEAENIDLSSFEEQVIYFKKYYEIVSIEEFERRFKEHNFTNKEIVLTFDDGYANNLYVAEPILRKYNLPFTVFVSTEHIDTGQFFPTSVNRILIYGAGLEQVRIPSQNLVLSLNTEVEKDQAASVISNLLKTLPLVDVKTITKELIENVSQEKWKELKEKHKSQRPLTWNELIELSNKPNVTIASHCKWHICCHSNQDNKVLKEEIEESKKVIEYKLNKKCNYFAYPNGDFTDYSNEIVKENYSLGFSTKRKERILKSSNREIIPRMGIHSDFNFSKVQITLFPF